MSETSFGKISIPLYVNKNKGKGEGNHNYPNFNLRSDQNDDGDYVNPGAAWFKQSKKGLKYISMSIDIDALIQYKKLNPDQFEQTDEEKKEEDRTLDELEDLLE